MTGRNYSDPNRELLDIAQQVYEVAETILGKEKADALKEIAELTGQPLTALHLKAYIDDLNSKASELERNLIASDTRKQRAIEKMQRLEQKVTSLIIIPEENQTPNPESKTYGWQRALVVGAAGLICAAGGYFAGLIAPNKTADKTIVSDLKKENSDLEKQMKELREKVRGLEKPVGETPIPEDKIPKDSPLTNYINLERKAFYDKNGNPLAGEATWQHYVSSVRELKGLPEVERKHRVASLQRGLKTSLKGTGVGKRISEEDLTTITEYAAQN